MKFNPSRRRRAEINVIPLIDILCMLLIFFIVTTTFKKKTASVDVTPPKSEKGTEKVEDQILDVPIFESLSQIRAKCVRLDVKF